MGKNLETAGLIEYLAKEAGCSYLSDLYQRPYFETVQKILEGIDSGKFSIEQWNDLTAYLTKEEVSFKTGLEAREYLLNLKK